MLLNIMNCNEGEVLCASDCTLPVKFHFYSGFSFPKEESFKPKKGTTDSELSAARNAN